MRANRSPVNFALVSLLVLPIAPLILQTTAIAQTLPPVTEAQKSLPQLMELGKQQTERKEYGAAIATYEQALKLAQQGQDLGAIVNVSDRLGWAYNSAAQSASRKGDDIGAIKLTEEELTIRHQGLEIAKKIPDRYLMMVTLRRLGGAYDAIGLYLNSAGQYDRALEEAEKSLPHLQQALTIAQELKDDKAISFTCKLIFSAHYGLVGIYRSLARLDAALEQIQKMREIVARTKDQSHERYIIQSEQGIYIGLARQHDRPEEYDILWQGVDFTF